MHYDAFMADVTLQALLQGSWRDVALLEFPKPELGTEGPCYFEYEFDHVSEWLGRDTPLAQASVRLPLVLVPVCTSRWPVFLDDLRPLGGARSWWQRKLGLTGGPPDELRLLREATIAPVGNLRVKEAVPPKDAEPTRFARSAVVEREHAFLAYAADRGAQVGGATGAGGESPKLLLRVDGRDQVWIDTWQDDPDCPDHHYLVKFARGVRSDRDRLILRSEYVYYRALAELGVETVPVEGMLLEEGASGPSLWLPRFDVTRRDGREVRLGLESIYSLLGKGPGSFLTHQAVIDALREVVPRAELGATLLEYLKRDLLAVVFGNTDNHGRNTALLKSETSIRLAPVYDFAPMKLDPEGIIRTTRWEKFEKGDIDWAALLRSFGSDEDFLRAGLRELAARLRHLPELLASLGLPDETLHFPALDLFGTERKLRGWGLL